MNTAGEVQWGSLSSSSGEISTPINTFEAAEAFNLKGQRKPKRVESDACSLEGKQPQNASYHGKVKRMAAKTIYTMVWIPYLEPENKVTKAAI